MGKRVLGYFNCASGPFRLKIIGGHHAWRRFDNDCLTLRGNLNGQGAKKLQRDEYTQINGWGSYKAKKMPQRIQKAQLIVGLVRAAGCRGSFLFERGHWKVAEGSLGGQASYRCMQWSRERAQRSKSRRARAKARARARVRASAISQSQEPERESLRASEPGMRWCSKPIVSM